MEEIKKISPKTPVDARMVVMARMLSEATAVVVFIAGGLVLVGWKFDIVFLKSILPIFRPMSPNAAVGLVFLGFSLWFLQEKRTKKWMRGIGWWSAAAAFLLGLLTLAEYVFGWNLFIDQLLFQDMAGTVLTIYPGRMGFVGSVVLILLGLALLLLDVQTRRGLRPAQFLSIISGAISLVTIVGYINDVSVFYTGLAIYTATAIHLAVSFLLLHFGILSARPNRGVVRVLVSNSFSGKMARYLIPASFTIPLIFGWAVEYAEHVGLYGQNFNLVLNTSAVIIVFSSFALFSAVLLERKEEYKMVAEEKIKEQQLKFIAQAKEVGQMKTDFISFASHQLRTPLTVISWNTEMLLSGAGGQLSAEQKKYLDKIARGEKRMAVLINSLLNISRLEAGRLKIEPKSTDVPLLISNVVSELAQVADARNCTVVYNSPKKPFPLISVDPVLLRQVLVNLLNNATHYSKPKKCRVEVDFKEIKGYYQIDIVDQGIGIPANVQDKLFDKFFRADNAIKADTQGTGLGLYIAKKIIETSGGKIWFESTEGKGSAFHFTIPITGMKKADGEKSLAV